MESWVPRRPSPKIEEHLFGRKRGPVAPMAIWSWLTPAAACALTLLVTVHNPYRHDPDFDSTNTAAVSSFMYDSQASNTPRTFVLSRADLNMEWNVWPHLAPWRPAVRATSLHPLPPFTNRAIISAEL